MEILLSIEDAQFGDQQELTANVTSPLSRSVLIRFAAGF